MTISSYRDISIIKGHGPPPRLVRGARNNISESEIFYSRDFQILKKDILDPDDDS